VWVGWFAALCPSIKFQDAQPAGQNNQEIPAAKTHAETAARDCPSGRADPFCS